MSLVEDKHMIQTFAAQRAHEPLGDRVGFWRPYGRADFPNPEGADLSAEFMPINAVPVADQILRWLPLEAGIHELLAGPACRGTTSDPRQHDLTAGPQAFLANDPLLHDAMLRNQLNLFDP